jgi:hypothetical protein
MTPVQFHDLLLMLSVIFAMLVVIAVLLLCIADRMYKHWLNCTLTARITVDETTQQRSTDGK